MPRSALAEKLSIQRGVHPPALREQGGFGMAGAEVPAWPDPTSLHHVSQLLSAVPCASPVFYHLRGLSHHLRELLLLEGFANKAHAMFDLYFLCGTEQNAPVRLAGILLLLY